MIDLHTTRSHEPRITPADRTLLRDALCAIPQFLNDRGRHTFIHTTFEGHPYSEQLDRTLQFLDWQGAAFVVADDLLRYVEGAEIAPGIPALRVLAEAIEPLAGMKHREQIRSLRERLGWADPPQPPDPAAATPTPDPAAIAAKRQRGEYDVFLCHNSKDKPVVIQIADRLIERGLLPWLDQDCLRPGYRWIPELERQIRPIPAAAVFAGPSGIGPWQDEELDAILRRFKKDNRPVIPVVLAGAPNLELPLFLDGRTWVDFRKASPDPLDQLVFGITGINPRFAAGV